MYFESPVRSIGRYEVAGRLATGGMGEILLARMRGPGGFERAVVIKRILPHLADHESAVRMFLDEARIVAGIRHPNVIQVHELIHDQSNLCIVMEYLEGESLSGVMRRMQTRGKMLDARLCAHVVSELAAGLHAAHELRDADGNPGGLVHRDVSPQNTFITYDGIVKILDFGIAYFHARRTKTETGTLRGKFEYMSPEQCLAKSLDRRSDVFALGVVLYELTTGHRLFRRKNQLLTLRAIVEETVMAPTQVVPGYPRPLEEIVMRALAKDPDERYQSAAEMRRDLVQAAHSASGALPDEALASLMGDLFRERREEKRAMLTRLRAGDTVDSVPEPEVDEDVELPTMDELRASVVITQPTDNASTTEASPVPSRRSRFAMGAVVVGIAGVAVAIAVQRNAGTDRTVTGPALSASTSESITAEGVVSAPAEPPAASVTLHIESSPPNAAVSLSGVERGRTPVDVEVPRGGEAIVIVLERGGYEMLKERVVPDVDQRLRLVMKPQSRRAPTSKPNSTGSGYRRFD